MIRVLLVEDQAMVRQGLKMMIETAEDIRVTGQAVNGKEALVCCEKHGYDIVILDIRMPEMNGIEAARIIHSRWPNCKILILTTFNDEKYALEALRNGANGYMLKDAEPTDLIRAIRSCLDGGLVLQDNVAAKVMPNLINQNEVEKLDPSITSRELTIIEFIGAGLSNKEIAMQLNLSIGTVKNNITIVLDKLALRDRTQIAIYAIRHHIV
ncbi:response regulator [Paraliobacillus zengyii]|uniref:response regulator n=1 Tax=Paraliobacillus zengyii TaxID=2213194 RepID=UPI000DD4B23E|nr:response regulator transcription factor [Paraliobacillus zengyii]